MKNRRLARTGKEMFERISFPGSRAKRGSILVVVLWALFFLAALAAAIYALLAPQIGLAGRLKDRTRLYYLAQAGAQKAMAVLADDETEDTDGFKDVWANSEEEFKDMHLSAEGYVSVSYKLLNDDGAEETRYGLVDEAGKINVNKATADVLEQLFELTAQTTSQTASDIADSILDWVDEDSDPHTNGAEDGYYEGLAQAYACKDAKFQIREELLLVKGMTQDIFDKVGAYLTVYGNGKVNFNTAGKYVLEALGMSDTLADKLIQFRRGNDDQEATADDNIFESVETVAASLSNGVGLSAEEAGQLNTVIASGLVGVRSDYFSGESNAELRYDDEEEARPTTNIFFVVDRGKNIRYWREQ